MCKTALLIVWILLTLLNEKARAQEGLFPHAGADSLEYGLQIGLSLSHFTGHNTDGEQFGNQNLVRFRGGGNLDIPLGSLFSIRPEALFSTAGVRKNDSIKTDLSYLKIPTSIVINLAQLSSGYAVKDLLRVGLGSYFAYAFAGKFIDDASSSRVKFSNREIPGTISNYSSYFKRWDAGVNSFLELTGSNFYSQLGTSFGLTNIKPRQENPVPHQALCKNASINLSYGWRF
jgi:hypothetical protein